MKGIKIELEKDIQLLKFIAKTGFITEEFLPFLNMSESRLKQHIISDNIEKKGTYLIYGNATNVYVLTQKSKKRMQCDFLINLYKGDLSQLEHDYVLSKIYLSLNNDEKDSWITESKLELDYPKSDKTTDGIYISRANKRVGVEVITSNYSKDDIEKKKEFIRKYCDDFIMIHTHKNVEYKL